MPIYKHKNQDFTFNNIYYVSTTGLDTNDGLTIDTAFLTCGKAANVAQTGDAIVFDKGRFCITYDLGNTGVGRGGLSDYGKSITFFGQDINTILYNDPNLMLNYRDIHIVSLYGINSKVYTRNCMLKHDLPIKPIYQVFTQQRNKADIIKGRCDVLIDDDRFNVEQCISAGVPALLIDRPHNQDGNMMYRIFSLDYAEIEDAYNFLKFQLEWPINEIK